MRHAPPGVSSMPVRQVLKKNCEICAGFLLSPAAQPHNFLKYLRAQAQARVAWPRRKLGGSQEIRIEFLDRNNFWDVDWSAADAVV